jgi:6-phosphogluconate dehydrogenase
MIIVDRIENELAICEIDGTMVNISLTKISNGVREGDVLIDSGNGSFYTVDSTMTKQRKNEMAQLFERLKTRHKK